MAQFGKKKSYSDYLYTKPVLAFLLLCIILLSFAVFKRYSIERDMYARQTEIESQKQELLERKTTLQEKVEYLEGERGIEEEIRKHFDVAREGEQVVILIGDDDADTPEPKVTEEEKSPWYVFWR